MTVIQRIIPVSEDSKKSFESLRYYYAALNNLYNPKNLVKKYIVPGVVALVIAIALDAFKSNLEAHQGLLLLVNLLGFAAMLTFGILMGKATFKIIGPKLLSKSVKEGTAANFKGRLVEVAEQQAGPFGPRDSAKVFVNGEYLTGGLASLKELEFPLNTITMVRFAGDSGTLVPTAPLHFLFGEKEVEMWRSDVPPADETEFDVAIAKAEKDVLEKPVEM